MIYHYSDLFIYDSKEFDLSFMILKNRSSVNVIRDGEYLIIILLFKLMYFLLIIFITAMKTNHVPVNHRYVSRFNRRDFPAFDIGKNNE